MNPARGEQLERGDRWVAGAAHHPAGIRKSPGWASASALNWYDIRCDRHPGWLLHEKRKPLAANRKKTL
jgi:hypothetical protein